jgi:hypothetical protein
VTLFEALLPNRTQTITFTYSGTTGLSQLMEGITTGALIPAIVHRSFQDLLQAEVSALTGAQLHERYPDQYSTHHNVYREGYSPPRWATSHPGHPQTAAGHLLPQLARTGPPGRQGPLRRRDGALNRWHLHPQGRCLPHAARRGSSLFALMKKPAALGTAAATAHQSAVRSKSGCLPLPKDAANAAAHTSIKGPWRWTTWCLETRAARTTSATCRPFASAAMP